MARLITRRTIPAGTPQTAARASLIIPLLPYRSPLACNSGRVNIEIPKYSKAEIPSHGRKCFL